MFKPEDTMLFYAGTGDFAHTTTIAANDFRTLLGPGVYVFVQKPTHNAKTITLYVGYGKRTLSRMSNPHHTKAQQALRECTHVLFFICKDEHDARELEANLIAQRKPVYNVAGIKGKGRFSTKGGFSRRF